MSEQIIKKLDQLDKDNLINNIQETIENTFNLKALRPQITQNIKARLNLLNYKPNQILGLGILDGSFSVYELSGTSSVNKPYEFEITFVSDDFIYYKEGFNMRNMLNFNHVYYYYYWNYRFSSIHPQARPIQFSP